MIVLGIDPGMADTGWGVVEVAGSRLRPLGQGVLSTAAGVPAEQRLAGLQASVAGLLDTHRPTCAALEDLFVGANPRTILSVGQARGAILAACGAAGVPVAGYAPAQIKTAVCGYGKADKRQVTQMVTAILGLSGAAPADHAADALAAAVCHAQMARSARLQVAG